MLRKPFAQSVKLVLLGLPLLCSAVPALGQTLVVRPELRHDVSPPLRDLAKNAPAQELGPREADELKIIPLPPGFKPAGEPDTVLQSTTTTATPTALGPTVGLNFEGLGTGFPNYVVNLAPPDTNGAVGKTQYVQWVNVNFAVFDKTTGNVLPNFPVPGNTLWQGFGGGCETDNDGDPVVTYDKLADRWVFTQFVVRNQPFLQCVAVSTTSDATGSYNRYSFQYPNFDDYPKLGVWPDAYYITFNMFGSTTFLGADACAFDRNAMLNGNAATQICFQQASTVGSLLPADMDGHVAPPAGSPNYMMDFDVNSLNLYKFHVDFATPANSTFTGPVNIPVAPFTPFCPAVRGCVPQPPGDGTKLDSLGDRLMYRLAYRNFANHESLVVNHSVIANPTALNSGVRWYEIQNPNGATPTVAQQSTFAPDATFRWMGSIAMDVSGDIAVGYSVSSSTIFPSIAFAARAFSDPSSTLQAETNLFTGTGSQLNGLTRWGDYSAMQVDPVDDCTFWYTTEYLANSGSFNWNTRIANFTFPGCGVPDLIIAKTHTGNFTQGQTGATYTITVTNAGGKDTDGTTVTVTDTLPAKLTPTAISGTNWVCTLGTLTCTRTDVLASGASYEPITLTVNVAADAPGLVTNSATVSGGGDKNPDNNTATDPTTVIMTGPDPAITKSHSGPFIQGQQGTYTIIVKNAGLSPLDGTLVTVTDTLPAGLSFNAASGTGWTCVQGPPVSCTRSDALASNASYPPITLTVNVANNAAGNLINSAKVAGGGDTNTLNNTASDPTTVITPPPDLTIAKSHTGNFNQGQNNAPYSLTVTNLGSAPTNATVTVTDTLPAGLTLSSLFGSGWFCNFSTATCTRNDVLAVNASYPPITVSVNVAGNAPASVTNTAKVSGGGDITPGNNIASDPTTINPAPDLTITKSHTPDPFIVGQTGSYTLTVKNIGSGATSGAVTVNDFLPFGLTATAITGTGWGCSAPPTTFITCTRSDVLAATSSYPAITVTVSVNGGGPAVTNTANVSGGGEFNTSNDSANDPTNISAPVLAITKTHFPVTFTVGQIGTYTINVSNTGKVATAGAVNVTDFLPNGLTATAVSGAGWNCSALPTTFLSCTRSDSLASGGSYPSLVVTVSVLNATPTVTNTASVNGGGDSLFHSASDTANVNTPTLTIAKSHTGDFTVGQIGNYTITVGNTGKVATVGTVTLTDFLPFGMTAVAAGGTGWGCSAMPTTFLTCTRSDTLATNASYPSLTVVASVTGGGPTATNTANVTGGGDALTHSANDTANVNAPVLGITKSHTGDPFIVGQTGTYTITLNNKAGKIATNGIVSVQDFLPSGLVATAVTGSGWSCSGTTFVNCTRSDPLAAGGTYPPITMTVNVNGGVPSVTNSVSVSGGGDPASHSAFDFTNINGPLLGITKSHTGDPFIVGKTGTYTITVNNIAGKTATTGIVTVQDFLPNALTATAVTATGWSCSPLPTTFLTCTRSDSLAAGGTYPPITMTVSVGGGGTSVFNTANVSGGGDSSSHSASDFTNISGPSPSLAITKSHTGDPFIVGQTGTYTITVDNKAGKTATAGAVSVQDFLPNVLPATAVTAPGWSCSALPTTFLNCSRSDSLATGGTYPPITVTVSVNGGGPSVTNFANASGGGDPNFHSASDLTNINGPVLAITKTHNPDPFVAGQTGNYTITVSNTGKVATAGIVTVQDFLPSGLTISATSGTGWGCSGITSVTCTRSDALAPNSSYPPLTLTVNVVNSSPTIVNTANVSGGGDSSFHSASDTANVTIPTLAITKSHTGDFAVGQPGTYTITVSNAGAVATAGTVTLTDFLPFNMTATAVSGTGWGCSNVPTSFVTCTRSDVLAANSSYSPVTLTVSVNGGASNVTNTANVTGGGDGRTHSASDPTNITPTTLAITKSHSGDFAVGQLGTYTITVSNPGTIATAGTVSVSDSLPPALTVTSVNALNWNCSSLPTAFLSCQRSDALAGGSGYPAITMTVSVGANASGMVINQATVSGGGDNNSHTASDPTNIGLPDLAITKSHTGDFTVGLPGTYTITVSNVGTIATAGGSLIVDDLMPVGLTATAASGTGWTCAILPGLQTEMSCTRTAGVLAPGDSYPPITLTVSVAPNAPSSVTNTVSVFGIGEANFSNNTASDITNIVGLRFVAATPCRVADTRNPDGPFGGPFLAGGTTRGFAIPDSACGIPSTAQAYSLNVTVVPHGKLGFLTLFPCGQTLPLASTLNSYDGRIKAEAALVPAGTGGAVCVFVTDDTDVVLDINGYFVSATNTTALAFYPVTPCRLVDTRGATGPLGGPSLVGNATRTFPILSSACNVPATAQAYSLNFTSVPQGSLGFLTTWPAGQTQPLVSTLNAPTGTITANAAIVPAGTNGDISAFVTDASDLIIDIDGYFAPPSPSGLALFPLAPCRVVDTRNPTPTGGQPFSGTLDVNVAGSNCGASPSAQSYVLNATVVPPGSLGFLTLWPQGAAQPFVSTLNAQDGAVTSNMAIVPTTNGSVSAFALNPTHLILDLSGFFAP
jgi:uncharacterized repeat protein (TIGR01451 family)